MPLFKPAKASQADRGKEAEADVWEYLQALANRYPDVDIERLPDARSSGGRVPAQVSDFAVFAPNTHIWIEVKETEHAYRLSRSKVRQLAKLRRRAECGGMCLIVVHHSIENAWRCVPAVDLDPSMPSWDLSRYVHHDSAEAAISGWVP